MPDDKQTKVLLDAGVIEDFALPEKETADSLAAVPEVG